jgi:hypothetical protein
MEQPSSDGQIRVADSKGRCSPADKTCRHLASYTRSGAECGGQLVNKRSETQLSSAPAAGQPMSARQLRSGSFAALDQRVATRDTMAPMDLAESAKYQ